MIIFMELLSHAQKFTELVSHVHKFMELFSYEEKISLRTTSSNFNFNFKFKICGKKTNLLNCVKDIYIRVANILILKSVHNIVSVQGSALIVSI